MSDTTDSSSSFPALSDISDALSDITIDDTESAIHPPTLSGIAKELLLVEAHYATEEAGLRKQIEELESTVRRQAKSMASQEVVIECQAGEIKRQDRLIKRQGESINIANGIIKRANSFIATLLAQRDTLQSKGEHQLHYPNRTICVPIPPNSLSHEDSPLSHTSGTGSHACKELPNEASRKTASEALFQSDELSHSKIPSTVASPPISHFKRLPLDLQRKIWRLTFPEPQILEIIWSGTTLDVDSVAKRPVAMHICQDARREALSEYHQLTPLPDVGLVDLKRDTVYINGAEHVEDISAKLSGLCNMFSLGGIRHLAIQDLLWWRMIHLCKNELFEILESMKELQELTIIMWDKVPENSRVERRQSIEVVKVCNHRDWLEANLSDDQFFEWVVSMKEVQELTIEHPRLQPLLSKIRYGSVKKRSVFTESSDNPLKSLSTLTNLEDFSTKPTSTLEAAIASSSVSPASTQMQINPFANPSVNPASTPVRVDVFSNKRASPLAKSVSTLEVATHPSVKPVVSTPTTTADTPARLLPTPKTTLTTPDIPVSSPTPKPYCEPKFALGKPTPFFTFGDPIPVSLSKFARGLKPHHTHTRSKSAELRVSPAMPPFSSQKPLEEPEGWKPEDWNKYLRFGPPTADNVF